MANNRRFIDRTISVKRAAAILGKNNLQVSEGEAVIILDFLYLIAQTMSKPAKGILEAGDGK